MLELELALLAVAQKVALPLDLALLEIEIHEHRHLRSQHVGVEGLEHVVHRAHRVTLEDVRVFLADRAQEDDRDGSRFLARLDDLRDLEAVHTRHLDVEQDHGEFLAQHPLQSFRPRVGANQILAELLENRFEREKIFRSIVDEEDVDALVAHTVCLTPTFARS